MKRNIFITFTLFSLMALGNVSLAREISGLSHSAYSEVNRLKPMNLMTISNTRSALLGTSLTKEYALTTKRIDHIEINQINKNAKDSIHLISPKHIQHINDKRAERIKTNILKSIYKITISS